MSIIDRYVRRIFFADRELVSWHSRPVDHPTKSSKIRNTESFTVHKYAKNAAEETPHRVVVSRPVSLAPFLLSPVLLTSTSSDLLAVKSRFLRASRSSFEESRGTKKGVIG